MINSVSTNKIHKLVNCLNGNDMILNFRMKSLIRLFAVFAIVLQTMGCSNDAFFGFGEECLLDTDSNLPIINDYEGSDDIPLFFKEVAPVVDPIDDEYAFNSVYEGNSDLAFTESCDFQKLKYVPLIKEDSMAVLPKGHRLSKYDVIPLEELLKEPFLSNCFSDKISTPLEFFASRGLSANVILRIEDNTSVMEMVERGIGVSILPKMVLRDESFQIDIRRTEPMTTRNIYLAYVNKRVMPIAAVRFMEYVIEETSGFKITK